MRVLTIRRYLFILGRMGKLLLVGGGSAAWADWLKDNRAGRDLVVLDPADAHYGAAGRLWVLRGIRPIYSAFYGSLDPQRAPHLLMAALHEFLGVVDDNALVQLYPMRATPLMRQMTQTVTSMVRPARILMPSDEPDDAICWPVGPEAVELIKPLPSLVLQAQRKAQWLKLIERSSRHEIPLDRLTIQGARLGSGRLLDSVMRQRAGLEEALRVEVCGSSLLVVTKGDLKEDQVTRALDITHTQRAHIVHPEDYENLLCALVRLSGEEFGYGRVEALDFEAGMAVVMADAVPPVPIPILRLGSLRVDADGRELGEVRPWQV